MATQTANNRRIDSLLAEYGESHQNATNKFIHWICVPVIVWTATASALELAGSVVVHCGAVSQLVDVGDRASDALLPDPLRSTCLRHGRHRGNLLRHQRQLRPTAAALANSAGGVRSRMDRAIHRTQDRRQETVLFQGHSVPADRTGVAPAFFVSQGRDQILTRARFRLARALGRLRNSRHL
jgi:hypothetical protein